MQRIFVYKRNRNFNLIIVADENIFIIRFDASRLLDIPNIFRSLSLDHVFYTLRNRFDIFPSYSFNISWRYILWVMVVVVFSCNFIYSDIKFIVLPSLKKSRKFFIQGELSGRVRWCLLFFYHNALVNGDIYFYSLLLLFADAI